MEVIRVKRDENNPYVTINKTPLQDKNLSLEAKGLLCVILSLPPSWDFTVEGMSTITNHSAKVLRRIINELIANDYCKKNQLRKKQGFGKVEYVFSEIKLNTINSVLSHLSKAQTSKAQTCKAQKGAQLSNESIDSSDILKNDEVEAILRHYQNLRKENFVDLNIYSDSEKLKIINLVEKFGFEKIKTAIEKAVTSPIMESWENVHFNNIFTEDKIPKLLRGEYDKMKTEKKEKNANNFAINR